MIDLKFMEENEFLYPALKRWNRFHNVKFLYQLKVSPIIIDPSQW